MNTEATNELVQLEQTYWKAIKDRDVETCTDLSAEGCVVTGAQGVGSYTKAQMREMMEQGTGYTLDNYELKDVKADMLDTDVGMVAYTVHQTLTVDGKPVVFDSADTSVWVRHSGKWECMLHTESILGDPFGQDKAKK